MGQKIMKSGSGPLGVPLTSYQNVSGSVSEEPPSGPTEQGTWLRGRRMRMRKRSLNGGCCVCGGRVMRKEWWGPDVATWVGCVTGVWAGSEKDKPVTLPLQTGQCDHWAEGTSVREGEPVWALSSSESAEKVPLEGSDRGSWTLQQAAPLNLEPGCPLFLLLLLV